MNDRHRSTGNRGVEQNPAYDLLQPINFKFKSEMPSSRRGLRRQKWRFDLNLAQDGETVTDQQLWSAAAERVKADYETLPQALKLKLGELSAEIMVLKARHQAAVSSFAAEAVCAKCKGLCCRFGKHHFTVIDLLVYLSAGRELFTPSFDNPVCPYHSGSGCLMEPALRPFNCIIFICEQLDTGLAKQVSLELAGIESRLRRICAEFEQLLGNRFANGLLITYQRVLDAGTPLLNCQEPTGS